MFAAFAAIQPQTRPWCSLTNKNDRYQEQREQQACQVEPGIISQLKTIGSDLATRSVVGTYPGWDVELLLEHIMRRLCLPTPQYRFRGL